jgi:predicted SnoaL-like aldol condensation-catalyzing enzyme
MKKLLMLVAVLAATSVVSLSAQYQVPRQTSYAMNAAEKANLQIAHDFWRDIMLGGNLDIASHYMPADFISRNPNVAAGRDAFVKALRENPLLFQNTRRQRAGTPEVEFAKNDYVFFMWANFVGQPDRAGQGLQVQHHRALPHRQWQSGRALGWRAQERAR